MDSLRGIISDIGVFFNSGISRLPLTIAGTLLILGLFSANYAMLFFLIGYLIGVPLLTYFLNWIGAGAFHDLLIRPTNDSCHLVVPFSTQSNPAVPIEEAVIFSTPTAMAFFFLAYILSNAVDLFQKNSDATADAAKVSNRKTNSLLSITCIGVFFLYFLYLRYKSGCESPLRIMIGAGIFSLLGYGWYTLLSKVADGRLSDLTGIANRLLQPSAMQKDVPVACFAT